MAVVQISRIQHRRGLQENLPNLAAAEIAWSIDARRLFIGNGPVEEGSPPAGAGQATEILTENSKDLILELLKIYQFKGLPAGSVAQTGSTALDFIERSLQEKLDDFVNVRDFGAKGDGITDDTAAINRALNNTLAYSNFLSGTIHHRIVYFPAGKYLVSETIQVPPFVGLRGEGKTSTVIEGGQTVDGDDLEQIIRLYDSADQTGNSFGSSIGLISTRASDYLFQDIGFKHRSTSCLPAVRIDGGRGIYFSRVAFFGPGPQYTGQGSGHALISIPNVSNNIPAVNLVFDQCDFVDHCTAIEAAQLVSGITIEQSYFYNVYRGWSLNQTVTNFTVRSSVFQHENEDGSGISSGLVGDPVDFSGATVDDSSVRIVGKKAILSDNATGAFLDLPAGADDFDELTMSYTISRGGVKRRGVLVMSGDGSFSDEYTEQADIGIEIYRDSETGKMVYSSTSTGSSADISFTIEILS